MNVKNRINHGSIYDMLIPLIKIEIGYQFNSEKNYIMEPIVFSGETIENYSESDWL